MKVSIIISIQNIPLLEEFPIIRINSEEGEVSRKGLIINLF